MVTNVFQIPEKRVGHVAPALVSMDEQFVNLTTIVQGVLEAVQRPPDQQKIILRCDTLPLVEADALDMQQLSNTLLNCILEHPPRRGKLFIYIKCNRANSEHLLTPTTGDIHHYEICFHTNSSNEPGWHEAHLQALELCEAICSRYNGLFSFADSSAACLFQLTLPGKLI